MSASLVGSEMCIRDSGSRSGRPSDEERKRHECTHVPFRSWCQRCVRGRTVSYTHLTLPTICSV
eukprot:8138024-Alexandrium_andersonii.AAC.1